MVLRTLLDAGLAVLRARWYLRAARPLGARVRVWGRPVVHIAGGRLIIGDRVRLVATVAPLELAAAGGVIEIGAGTYVNYGSSISAGCAVTIGRDCSIGTYCVLADTEHPQLAAIDRAEHEVAAPIRLEENVWLGARVVVQGGVTIGAGSAIGAGSVVCQDVPPRSLAVGVPAKVIRRL